MNTDAHAQLAHFFDYLRARNLSGHTVDAYRRDLRAVVSWCDKKGIASWQHFDRGDARAFIAERHRKGMAPRSLRRNLAAIRSFYRQIIRQGIVGHDPASDIPVPKIPKHLPTTIDTDQMAYLLQPQPGGITVVRDAAIMELLYSSGLRLSELIALDIDAFSADGMLRVDKGKGGKQRLVPVGRQAQTALHRWRQRRDEWAAADERALFISRRGTRLTPRAVQLRVKKWARERAVVANVHPHLLRHSCASHLLESSGDLRAVQELLGHANLSTTQIYTHLDFQHLARIYDNAHPRAKKKD